MDDVIHIDIDTSGRVVDVSGAAATRLAADPRDYIGFGFLECINQGDIDRLTDRFGPVDGRPLDPSATAILRLVDEEGRSIWVDLSVSEPPTERPEVVARLRARPFSPDGHGDVDPSDTNRHHVLVQQSADIVMTVQPDGMIRSVNPAMLGLLGMEPDELIDSQILRIIHPKDHDVLTDAVVRVLEEPDVPQRIEFRTQHRDGTYRWIDGWLQNLIDHPDVRALLGSGRDVTDRHQAEEALAASEERFRSLASSSPSAIFELDVDGAVRFANDRWRDVTGRDITEPVEIFTVLVHSDAARLRERWQEGHQRTGLDADVRVLRPDGTLRWVELHTRPVEDLAVTTHVGSLHDVTAIREAHSELEFLATHDSLTRLPNRELLRHRLDEVIERAGRTGELFALLFVDLDRFKVVNDSLGHQAGDIVLTTVTARLEDLVRPDDVIARFGGDEFVVLCDRITDVDQAVELAERIRREVAGEVEVGDQRVHVSVSVGLVLGDGTMGAEELLRDADAAMYVAKTSGRNRAQVFDERMHRSAMERLSVEAGLRRGLERSEFRLHFQPIVQVATRAICGVEALVRWEHPERGLLEPTHFLHIAEDSGLLGEIGPWILEQACREAARWQIPDDVAAPDLFVNLAAVQIANRGLPDVVDRVVAGTGIDAKRLVLEVTEGMLVTEADETAELLAALRGTGARIAIDDFGTGYSSLSYLTRLPADVLKIDQSFVAGLAETSKDREVTGAIIALAHALGLVTIAEGVEHPDQLEALASLGCDLAQGFLFSEPVAGDRIPALLTRR